LNHTDWVDALEYVAPEENLNVDVPDIGIIGQNKAIERIMWSVFKPREFSAELRRRKLSKRIFHFTIQFQTII
jgi:hypothetical protein